LIRVVRLFECSMNTFVRWPSLGGVLAIVNGLSWLALFLVTRYTALASELTIGIAMLLSLPIAFPFLLPRGHQTPTDADTIFLCVVIGLNAFAWGYGVSWLWQNVIRRCSLRVLFAVMTTIAVLLAIWRLG